ncbi:hypothetical protein Poly24_33000 [Rosistilla carotiformis]|uniref:Uncharacterized protein n=1 Tax=Rosistilla carotiformis TaxID=2528017 RepID=A0A518JVL1_9BACT|nr:hypothetical protein [Rosistilla carotiformis]QDV69584.1 hypothetical protein Poly24_33000 [Rosistilla carotiformis]
MKRILTIAALVTGITVLAGTSDAQARDYRDSGRSAHNARSPQHRQSHDRAGHHHDNRSPKFVVPYSSHGKGHIAHYPPVPQSPRRGYLPNRYPAPVTPYVPVPVPTYPSTSHSHGFHLDLGPLHLGIGSHR